MLDIIFRDRREEVSMHVRLRRSRGHEGTSALFLGVLSAPLPWRQGIRGQDREEHAEGVYGWTKSANSQATSGEAREEEMESVYR